MADYYTRNPSELKGQPKATIADYVEENGILVPKRYSGLEEALENMPFIMRSEHTQEYDGASGLLESHTIDEERLKRAEESKGTRLKKYEDTATGDDILLDRAIVRMGRDSQRMTENKLLRNGSRLSLEDYCKLKKIDEKEFILDCSFSYWEKLGGYNRSIVADSAIEGRYHLFTTKQSIWSPGFQEVIDPGFHNYSIIDTQSDIILINKINELTEEMKKQIPEIIEFYEKIRNLENFDPNHCPIIEFQTVEDKHYFLQYHRTRDFNPATFTLRRELKKNEFEFEYVRGATKPEGETFNIGIDYMTDKRLLEKEDGCIEWGQDPIFYEIMRQRRGITVMDWDNETIARRTYDNGHGPKSRLFKSKISIGLDRNSEFFDRLDKLRREEMDKVGHLEHFYHRKKTFRVPIHVTSDGNRAIGKVLK